MKKAVIFDLDGTLLPMNEEEFTKVYFGLLYKKAVPFGYKKEEFVNAIMKGTYLMRKNDGSATNEEVFWGCFAKIFGEDKLKDKKIFDEFYLQEFEQTKVSCGFNPKAKELIDFCRKNFQYVILASNPIFPKEAMEWRVKFAGIDPEVFDFMTDYSNSRYCKPNKNFLLGVMDKFSLKPNEVVYIGNSEIEDGVMAKELGVQVLMLGDQIIKDESEKYTYDYVSYDEVENKLEKIIKE